MSLTLPHYDMCVIRQAVIDLQRSGRSETAALIARLVEENEHLRDVVAQLSLGQRIGTPVERET